jgi:hypothetical protein
MNAKRPVGQAMLEYLVALIGVGVIWLAFEHSPAGLIQALRSLSGSYSFSLSIPW